MASTEPFISSIYLWSVSWAPVGFTECQGQLLNVSQYQALYSLVGINYGGNGSVNFNLPDLRGRTPIGAGVGPGLTPRALGAHDGAEQSALAGTATFAITTNNLPIHIHDLSGATLTATSQMSVASGNASQPAPPTGGQIAAVAAGRTTFNTYSSVAAGAVALKPAPLNGSLAGSTGVNTTKGTPVSANLATGKANIIQPSVGLNTIMALTGLYPPRP